MIKLHISENMCEVYPYLSRCQNIGHLDCDNNDIVKLDDYTNKGRNIESYKEAYFTETWSKNKIINNFEVRNDINNV